MENFRVALKGRILWLVILDLLAIVFVIATGIYGQNQSGNMADFIRGFQVGIFVFIQGFIFVHVYKYLRAMRDENKLKILQVAENDERSKFIRDKIGGGGFLFSTIGIAVGTVAAGFLDETVFFTLLAVTIFMVSIKASLKVYYNTKY